MLLQKVVNIAWFTYLEATIEKKIIVKFLQKHLKILWKNLIEYLKSYTFTEKHSRTLEVFLRKRTRELVIQYFVEMLKLPAKFTLIFRIPRNHSFRLFEVTFFKKIFQKYYRFLDSLASNSFIPLILQPTRIMSHSNILIDNTFSNVIGPDITSGNLTATISDHLPQFSIIHNMFGNISGNKSNIYEKHWPKFDRENFIIDYFSIDWEDLLKIDQLNADSSTKIYLDKINMFRYLSLIRRTLH